MPFMLQLLGLALFIVGAIFAIYLWVWLLLILFAVGIASVAYSHIRDFLVARDILNPTPGVPPQQPAEEAITVIEGDFVEVKKDESLPNS